MNITYAVIHEIHAVDSVLVSFFFLSFFFLFSRQQNEGDEQRDAIYSRM